MALTDKQKAFVQYYSINFNAADAARKAGYSKSTAKVQARKLLENKYIQQELAKIQKDNTEKIELERHLVIQELALAAFRDVGDLFTEDGILINNVRDMPFRIRRCVDSLKVKHTVDQDGNTVTSAEIKLTPKLQALQLAMQHLGLLQPQEHEVRVSIDTDQLFGEIVDVEDHVEKRLREEEEKIKLFDKPKSNGKNGRGNGKP